MKQWIVAAIALAAASSSALAHDTWMLSDPAVIKSGAAVTLHVTSGMAFPKPETAPDPARIARCAWRIGGNEGTLTEFEKQSASLVVSGRVNTDGVAVIYAQFHPKEIDLKPEEVAEYFEEIGAPESVRRAYQAAGNDAPFHETYTKYAKTYLRVGDSGDATGCLGPVGFGMDFLPNRDPTTLKVGDTIAIKVIGGGEADEMEGFSVSAVRGSGKTTMQRTSKAGMVAFEVDAPGWWLIRGTELRRNADGTWKSEFTTLTFFVSRE
jgi:uncharacterized GH25 family protein